MANYIVTNNNDSGAGSLRFAIGQANATGAADTITFDAGLANGLIRLTSGELVITNALTIDGEANNITITGDGNDDDITIAATDITDVAASGGLLSDNSRIFNITSVTSDTTIDGLTLTGGYTNTPTGGGGAVRSNSTLVILDSTIIGNSTAGNYSKGGGVFGVYTVDVINSTISNNSTDGNVSQGGGVYANGDLAVTSSNISGNSTDALNSRGGGLYGFAFVTITNSTLSGNSTAGLGAPGGGAYSRSFLTATNSTISGNITTGNDSDGGGLGAGFSVILTNTTVSGNTTTGTDSDGGGVFSRGNSNTGVSLTNSIVMGNVTTNAADNETTVFSGTGSTTTIGNNILGSDIFNGVVDVGDTTAAAVFHATTNNNGVDAGVLADNGAAVQTIAIAQQGDAHNTGSDVDLPLDIQDIDGDANVAETTPFDSRGTGFNRLTSGQSDIGAFEIGAYTVTTLLDTGDDFTLAGSFAADLIDGGGLSLREAIGHANNAASPVTIEFDAALAGGTVLLNGQELALTSDITIDGDSDGNEKADVIISGNDSSRIFNITGAGTDVDIISLTMTNGLAARGGAIAIDNGLTLNLLYSTVRDSTATVHGGGIYNEGILTTTNSTISSNSSQGYGGGIYAQFNSSATFINTTIYGNAAQNNGGGIDTGSNVSLTIINSTITGNSAGTDGSGIGGGIDLFSNSTADIRNSVVALNTAISSADISETSTPSTLTAQNSFFGSTIAIDVNNGGNFNTAGDPLLSALADHGGPVETLTIQDGSTLINAGLNALVPAGITTDANGDARIQETTVDIGADEFFNGAPTFDATLTSLTAAFTFDGDDTGDNFGGSVFSAGDVNGDGFDDNIISAAFDDNNGLNNSGSARVLSGIDGAELFTFNGEGSNVYFGNSVSGAGDVNGDGFDDLIVGAPRDNNNGLGASGSARVLSGHDGAVLFTFNGDSSGDQLGISVSAAGDVNGDGFDDLIVGADKDDNNALNDSGSARVLSGFDGSELFTFDGEGSYDYFGKSVSGAGDVNGDGFDDVIVGAHQDDNNGLYGSGSARVLSGVDGSELFTFNGDSASDYFGNSVSAAGDVNGDGFDDIIVGAYRDDNNGTDSGSARVLSGLDGSELFTFNGDGASDRFGFSVSSAGDVNGDGFDDVIVGAKFDDNNGLTNSGSARILSGVDGTELFTFNGDSAFDYFGTSVSSAGDVNGDGFDDVIVGAFGDSNNGLNSGSARLFTTTASGRLDSVRAFTEGNAAVVLDSDVTIADAELDDLNGGNGDYNGASLNIERASGGNADDLFDFAAMANVTVNSSNLEVGGMAIATFTSVGGVLNIAFTNGGGTPPTTALVNEVIQAVTYENPVTTMALGENELLPLEWVFSDGVNNLTDTININHSGIGGRVLTGTPANDTLAATLGDDTVDGLAANDTLDFGVATAGVTVNLNLTGPQVTGGSGTDTITNIEHLSGGSGNDRFIGKIGATVGDNILSGEGGNDQLFGLGGNDTLNGGQGNDIALAGAGNDMLNGDAGDDILKGGNDNDTLTGGVGRDQLYGEAGADTFAFNDVSETGLVYADRDIIRDFSQAEGDLIDLSGIDADTSTMADDAFTFLGTFPSTIPSIPFTNVAGQLFAVNTAGGQTVVWGDVDGDGTQDFTFVLDGVLALTDSDFIL